MKPSDKSAVLLTSRDIRTLMQNDLPVFCADFVDSTNSWARRSGERRAVFAAGSQTGGRGRLGREFASPEGGVYMTFVFDPGRPPENALTVTAAASVAVMRAIERTCGVRTDVKWVNDLYLHGRKVCGILTEAAGGRIMIGVGVNLRTSDLPEELKGRACGLDAPVSRRALIAAIADMLCYVTADPDDRSWFAEYRKRSLLPGKDVVFYENASPIEAHALDIDKNCGLVVRLPDGGIRTLTSGEVSVKIK